MPEIETAHRSLPDLCAERGSAESKSERDDGCAKAGAAGQNLRESGSGQRRRANCIRSGTNRTESVGARRPEPSARISGRVVRAAATGKRIRSGTSRNETMGARRPELQARISGRVVLASGEGRAHSIGYESEGDDGCAKAGAECKNLGESGSSISDGRAHSIGYKSEPDIDASAAGLGMGRVGRRGRSKGRDTRSRRPIDLGRTWKFAGCEVEGRCAKAGAECKNLGESGSGQWRRTSAFDRVQVGTRRWVREGRSCRPESRGEWFWPAAHGRARSIEIETADRSKAGFARSQAGMGALCKAAQSRSQKETSVRVRPDLPWAQSVEKSKQRSRSQIETANRSKAGLARSQAGIGALNRAVHGPSRRQTSVQTRPDLPWVESAKKSKQETK